MLAGLVVGWRVHNGFPQFQLAVVLLLSFAYVMSWIGVWIGLSVPNTETAQQLTFVTIFPLTFISNVFVPPESLPPILQPIAEWNPVSTLTASTRVLFGNPNPYVGDGSERPDSGHHRLDDPVGFDLRADGDQQVPQRQQVAASMPGRGMPGGGRPVSGVAGNGIPAGGVLCDPPQ